MAILSAASTIQESAGSLKLLMFTFSSVDDDDTFASGLGGDIVTFWYQVTADPTTNTSAGCNVANSSGTFTFYPATDSLTGTLFVLARNF